MKSPIASSAAKTIRALLTVLLRWFLLALFRFRWLLLAILRAMALLLALLAMLKFTRPLRSTSLSTRSSVNRAWPCTAVSADVSNGSQVRTLKRKDSILRRSDGTGGFPSPGPSSIFLGVFSPKEKLIETNSRNVSAFWI